MFFLQRCGVWEGILKLAGGFRKKYRLIERGDDGWVGKMDRR